MASDSSQLLYLCPICSEPFRDERSCRNHIKASNSDGHGGVNGFTMDRPLDVREPSIEEVPADEWLEEVEEWVRLEAGEKTQVPYGEVAERTDLPKSYVVWALRHELDRTPVKKDGTRDTRTATSWEDLTDKQQHTLLAWAYFPDLSHEEISDLRFSGHGTQNSVSRTIREHGWMLGHPEIETPVEPTSSSDADGSVSMEGDLDDLMDSLERTVPGEEEGEMTEFEKGYEEAVNPGLELGDLDGSAGAGSSTDDPGGEPGEEAASGPDSAASEAHALSGAVHHNGTAVLESELAFEALAAFIETGRYEEARSVFDRATGDSPLDVRWEANDE